MFAALLLTLSLRGLDSSALFCLLQQQTCGLQTRGIRGSPRDG